MLLRDVYPVSLATLGPAWPGPVRLTPSNPRNYRIAESPNRRGAHFDRIANREALPRDSARFGQPWVRLAGRGGDKLIRPKSFRPEALCNTASPGARRTRGRGQAPASGDRPTEPRRKVFGPAQRCRWRPFRASTLMRRALRGGPDPVADDNLPWLRSCCSQQKPITHDPERPGKPS